MFRELSRVAVATSFGAAGMSCTGNYRIDDLGPEMPIEPTGGFIAPPSGGASGASGASGGGGIGGTGGSTGGIGGTGGSTGGIGGTGGSTGGIGGTGGSTGGMIAPPPPDAGPPDDGWQPIGCSPSGAPVLFPAATLANRIEHAALYRLVEPGGGELLPLDDGGVASPSFQQVYAYGVACASALDVDACLSTIQSLIPSPQDCAIEGQCDPFFITTNGDSVTRIEEIAALSALLGPINTNADAAIAALLAGLDVACYQPGNMPPTGTQVREVEGGYEVQNTTDECWNPILTTVHFVQADGTVSLVSETSGGGPLCAIGRRPEGLLDADRGSAHGAQACSELGAYFASAARLEAASVHAFERFAGELEGLGASSDLIADATRAALEEIDHAHVVSAIARRFGGELSPPQIEVTPARDALAIALENAVEGCVRETYGALVACYQASTALDPVVRGAMLQIADDETRHAELSWRVAQWLEPRLSEDQQLAVEAARQAAFRQLESELATGLSAPSRALIGMPDVAMSTQLLHQLGSALAMQA